MATTTNYGWTTPDDTALVKDGASAIRTLGSSVDTTTKNLNPETTLGDIAYRSSTANVKTRLGLGTAGQVLQVNSGATAPEWATPSTANWSLLNSGGTALTGAQTVTVSGISGKDKIMVLIDAASSASASSIITVRLNADTGSNYYQFGENAYYPSTYAASNFDVLAGAQPYIRLAKMSASASSAVTGYVLLSGCNSAGVKVFNSIGGASAATSNNHESWKLGGYYNSASTISSVSVFSTTGDLDAGTVYVYTSA